MKYKIDDNEQHNALIALSIMLLFLFSLGVGMYIGGQVVTDLWMRTPISER